MNKGQLHQDCAYCRDRCLSYFIYMHTAITLSLHISVVNMSFCRLIKLTVCISVKGLDHPMIISTDTDHDLCLTLSCKWRKPNPKCSLWTCWAFFSLTHPCRCRHFDYLGQSLRHGQSLNWYFCLAHRVCVSRVQEFLSVPYIIIIFLQEVNKNLVVLTPFLSHVMVFF